MEVASEIAFSCFLFVSDRLSSSLTFLFLTFNNLVMRNIEIKKLNNAQERDKTRSDNKFYGKIGIFLY